MLTTCWPRVSGATKCSRSIPILWWRLLIALASEAHLADGQLIRHNAVEVDIDRCPFSPVGPYHRTFSGLAAT